MGNTSKGGVKITNTPTDKQAESLKERYSNVINSSTEHFERLITAGYCFLLDSGSSCDPDIGSCCPAKAHGIFGYMYVYKATQL